MFMCFSFLLRKFSILDPTPYINTELRYRDYKNSSGNFYLSGTPEAIQSLPSDSFPICTQRFYSHPNCFHPNHIHPNLSRPGKFLVLKI